MSGGGLDLAFQLAKNGGDLSCVDWGRVGAAAAMGAMGGMAFEVGQYLFGSYILGAEMEFGFAAEMGAEATEVGSGFESAEAGGARESAEASYFDDTFYGEKVTDQMDAGPGDFHSFPESVKAFEGDGTTASRVNGDGTNYHELRIPGSYTGKMGKTVDGDFVFGKNDAGEITHRFFEKYKYAK